MNDELREFNKYTSTPVTEFSESDLTASLDVSSTLPAAYSNLNIVEHMKELHFQHTLPLQESDLYDVRFAAEMSWFQTKDKFDILKTVKFIVDRLKMASVPWGVGRGSSVYCYLLFLLELHAIDPIVHELDYREFLRV
jgi:DNA polymerase III alpha subunit